MREWVDPCKRVRTHALVHIHTHTHTHTHTQRQRRRKSPRIPCVGAHTDTVKQSSDSSLASSPCGQSGGTRVPSRTPSHGTAGSGGANRLVPVGATANGTWSERRVNVRIYAASAEKIQQVYSHGDIRITTFTLETALTMHTVSCTKPALARCNVAFARRARICDDMNGHRCTLSSKIIGCGNMLNKREQHTPLERRRRCHWTVALRAHRQMPCVPQDQPPPSASLQPELRHLFSSVTQMSTPRRPSFQRCVEKFARLSGVFGSVCMRSVEP